MEITHMFPTGSVELTDYLQKQPVQGTINGPDGTPVYRIMEVKTDPDVPPHPQTGELTTKVTLVVERIEPDTP